MRNNLPVFDEEEFNEMMIDGTHGFCIACGEESEAVEPDARQYTCDSCGEPQVYGLEELLVMGLIS